jgi:aspartate-semialdehyde dehydrogenase
VALDDEHSKRYVPLLLKLGYRVIDKSNTYRGDPNVPLVAAGVNDDIGFYAASGIASTMPDA